MTKLPWSRQPHTYVLGLWFNTASHLLSDTLFKTWPLRLVLKWEGHGLTCISTHCCITRYNTLHNTASMPPGVYYIYWRTEGVLSSIALLDLCVDSRKANVYCSPNAPFITQYFTPPQCYCSSGTVSQDHLTSVTLWTSMVNILTEPSHQEKVLYPL